MRVVVSTTIGLLLAGSAGAQTVRTYEDLSENFYGTSFTHQGVTYRDVNQVSGVFPDGSTFTPADLGDNVIVEDATIFYSNFPDYGSPVNSLTFGGAFINGPNLSVGAIGSVTMDLAEPASSASFDMAYYENGPWGGIVYHLDALRNGAVVGSDTFTISNLGGRDNIAIRKMSVSADAFDQLKLYATFGAQFSGPRGMIDNFTTVAVPEPAFAGALMGLGALLNHRRR